MLKQLHIRDFAIIDEVMLEFEPGMTVLTGETGAGKSILVDALGLILGDRADTGFVRHACERAEITAEFAIAGIPAVSGLLQEQEIVAEDDELLVRRVIGMDGRSRAFVNNSPVTAQFLKDLGEYLIDIHGQHEHQSLTRPDRQRELLDDYGGYTKVCAEVNAAYQAWHAATSQLQELLENNTDQEATLTLLRYQVDELQSLGPGRDEYASLDDEHRRLANGNRLLETSRKALSVFREDDDSLLSRLDNISGELHDLLRFDESLRNLVNTLHEASIQLGEASDELRTYVDSLEIDPEQLQQVEDRLSRMHDMARKHHIQPAELADHLATLQKKLYDMENSQQIISELLEAQKTALGKYKVCARKLHSERIKSAKKLSAGITAKLTELGMPNGRFSITVTSQDDQAPRSHGNDKVEFEVSPNPGQGLKPLARIASGGELSRISLAIQVIGNTYSGTPTLIFDEVDAGIGGGIAEIVGKLLHGLATRRQVFCVTHLAQVASQGDHHMQVAKESTASSTRTLVTTLDDKQRVEEVARMLGGIKVTEQSRKHAKEMLND